MIESWGIFSKIAIRWMSLEPTDDELTLAQAWCPETTSHYLNLRWPSSLSPYHGATGPQCVKCPEIFSGFPILKLFPWWPWSTFQTQLSMQILQVHIYSDMNSNNLIRLYIHIYIYIHIYTYIYIQCEISLWSHAYIAGQQFPTTRKMFD